jgi:VCBS repeat-containing protein
MSRRGRVARQNRRRSFFAAVEHLEDRSVLAGNVLASVAGGNLFLIGDASANQLEVTRLGANNVQITSLDGTTINGQTGPVTLNNVRTGITAALGDGDDVLRLTGASSTSPFEVLGNAMVNSGEGDDTIVLTNFSTRGALLLMTQGGDDTITADGLQVQNPAVIHTGAGEDNVSISNSTFRSNFLLDVGNDDDQVDVRNSIFQRVSHFHGGKGIDSLNDLDNTFRFKQFVHKFETETSAEGPTAAADTATVAEGGTVTISVLGNDVATEGTIDASTVTIVQSPTRGTVQVNANGTITYTNNGSEGATDTFSYTVRDSEGNLSNIAVVTVSVTPVNDAPVIAPIANVSVNEDTATGAIAVNISDAETAAGNLTVTATSSNPALIPNANIVVGGSGSNRTLVITPVANATGTSTITVSVTDANNVTSTQTFVVTVNPTNDSPTVTAIADTTVAAGATIAPISFTIGDVETPAANLTVNATSSNQALVQNSGIQVTGTGANRQLVITPVANATGTTTITVRTTDANGAFVDETFVLRINAQPTISAVADVSIAQNTSTAPIAITVGDAETAAANLQVTAASSNTGLIPLSGIVVSGTGANRTLVVTPVANATGSSTITLTVTDANGLTATEVFVVNVTP